ncbi:MULTISPECIES: hypothetical protein [unclassified Lysobacter]|uniref:hypothetical protein n=1 Tax=unclassified Lysobacter TaxID=2635362 RepID=UPI00070C4F06|nr:MULTISPECIES: hypothetical protein [unclassified Lysobacter]KRD39339.1 hypothetical protein ASE35_02985 [Lysobacter sp. Root916]KRD74517.1 hypothetical protein ASE43_14840 [Lysobacter sp. Root983]
MRRPSLLLLCLIPLAAAQARAPKLDDPRPNGHLSPRERSLCEAPERHPSWCEQPHEVRAFLQRYDDCEHWRGEEAPQGDRQRSKEIVQGANRACKGNDRRLTELRRRYQNVPAVAAVLSKLEFVHGP